jgi:nicotinamide-nucleotide amidase
MRIMPLERVSDIQLSELVSELAAQLGSAGLTLATAESCTGGWVAKLCTDLPGSSHWFECGFVTYSNRAKQTLLGVQAETLLEHGAVSEETVVEMVAGTLVRSGADVALAISGIAGPGGGSEEKPVGLVCFAWGRRGLPARCESCRFDGDREAVRRQAAAHALRGLGRV